MQLDVWATVGIKNAFGIFNSSEAALSGPQAFVGWQRPTAGPDKASEWNDSYVEFPYKGYGTMITEFFAAWMNRVPLDDCIRLASDQTEYKWPLPVPDNKNIYTKENDATQYTSPIEVIGTRRITRTGQAP